MKEEHVSKGKNAKRKLDHAHQNSIKEPLMVSEDMYKNIINNLMDIVIVLDLQGNFLYASPQIYDISGFTQEEIIGKSGFKLMHPDDIKKAAELLKDAIIMKKQVVIEYRTIHKDGHYIDVSASGRIVNIDGEDRIFAVVRDISEQRRSDKQLRESEEKYLHLFMSSPHSIIIGDMAGNIIDCNFKEGQITGRTREELIGKKMVEINIFPPESLPIVMNNFNLLLKGEIPKSIEVQIIKKDGSRVWVQPTASIFKLKDKKYFQIILQNVNHRKISEEKLRESEDKFRTITEQSFLGISILQDGKFKYVNQKMGELTGYSVEEMQKWSEQDIVKTVHPDDLKLIAEPYRKNKEGDPLSFRTTIFRSISKSGDIKWLETFSKKINYEGNPATLTTYMDITEKKEAEQELIKLNSLKSELLRRTSHELKTPLVSIKGFSDLLLNVHREKLDDYVLATVVEIKQGCERLESLIQDILNTAELESGAVQLKKVEEDLSFIIKLSVRELKGITRLRNHTITLNIHDKLIAKFEQEQIHRVVSSLLNNAIKFTPPNGNIEIKTEVKNNTVVVSIKDSGIGITEGEREMLFTQFGKVERYGQGHDIISDGSGLGLYISKKIIELHEGEIWVESQGRNSGSTFYFTLPIIPESDN
jgi:PAS domain S-box-containing protein